MTTSSEDRLWLNSSAERDRSVLRSASGRPLGADGNVMLKLWSPR
jgi:hypothetical protein